MIKLTKGNSPQVLLDKANEWTQEYLAAKETKSLTDTIKYRYRHPDIKSSIIRETSEKCAYCESKVTHIYPGECDHLLPIHHRPELIVCWENLTFTCRVCNHAKSDYYSVAEPLINPYTEDPAVHLYFIGPLACYLDDHGFLTWGKLKLYSMELVERRAERLNSLMPLIDRWKSLPAGNMKNLARDLIEAEAAPDREYSATVAAFIRHHPQL